MNIKFSLTADDADLAGIVARNSHYFTPVKDMKATFTPDGLVVSGVYDLFIDVAFSTLWKASVAGQELTLKLVNVSVVGLSMPGPMVKGRILKGIGEAVAGVPGVRLVGDELVVHAGDALASLGLNANVHLDAVRMYEDGCVVEAG